MIIIDKRGNFSKCILEAMGFKFAVHILKNHPATLAEDFIPHVQKIVLLCFTFFEAHGLTGGLLQFLTLDLLIRRAKLPGNQSSGDYCKILCFA